MTPEELAEIEERARKATAGPWTCIYRGHDELDGQKYDHDETPLLVMSPDCESHPVADASCNHTCRMPEDTEANAAFIAHARADVPALVAEVRRLREERDEATAADRREYAAMILRDYRGVEDPCSGCCGWGVRAYSSTATWRGGIGGQAITTGVCDACWGSGDRNRPGVDLRKAEVETRRLREALDAAQRIVKRKADREAGREET